VLLLALSTGHKLGLGLAGAVFAGYALIVSMVIPRRWPQFPGRRWFPWFLVVSALLFVGMMAAVVNFGKASEAAVTGTKVPVTEVEYKVELPKTTFAPGTYTFEVTNKGQLTHNLTIAGKGQGGTDSTKDIGPGSNSSVTVELESGHHYDFYCSIPGHRQQGMNQVVAVS
jgi:plastocyanin